MARKRVLVIAGSDSSGGAGLEADQKTIAAHGCYAMTATTALTAQNTLGVYAIHETPPEFVQKQIDACVGDIDVDVVKTGMLASEATVKVVAEALRTYQFPYSVVDPVMVSTSGSQLLPDGALQALVAELLPLTTILTPNFPEAQLILKHAGKDYNKPNHIDDIIDMAKSIQALGPKYVLLKGGHLPLTEDRRISASKTEYDIVFNVLYGDGKVVTFESEYLESRNTHGTGCSLASAIASNLALDMNVEKAVRLANYYVEAGIKTSSPFGKGSGPINHFHSVYRLPFSPGRFIEYLLDREDVNVAWKDYTEHDFVNKIADGSLPRSNFRHYLIQDYLFLNHFARAYALAAYKAKGWDDMIKCAKSVCNLRKETDLHVTYCKEFGLSEEEMMRQEESAACTAYTRYILDIGHSEDWFALQLALLPCMLGYGVIAQRLYNGSDTIKNGNPYYEWITSYASNDFQTAVGEGRGRYSTFLDSMYNQKQIEKHAIRQSESRIDELANIFIHATRLEAAFWDMGAAA